MRPVLLPAAAFLLLAAVLPGAAPPGTAPAEVRKLIERLGDESFDSRSEAMKKLEALGEAALPGLRQAAKSHADPDVRLRAVVLAAAIHKKLFGELFVLTGHTGWVFRVVVLPGGKQAVSSGDALRVWDLEKGTQVRQFAPNAWAWGLAVSADGKRVLACHGDRIARLYELETGKLLQQFVGHTHEIWAAGLSPDGAIAITGAYDRTLRAWDVATGKLLRSFVNVVDLPRCLAWSPDGKRVAVGHFRSEPVASTPGTVRVWDVETGKEVLSCTGHTGAVTAVAWTKDAKRIVSGSFDRTVRVWDAKTGKQLQRLVVSGQGCDGMAITPDGKRLVSAGWGSDHAVRLWDLATGTERACFTGHTGSALSIAITPDGTRALSSSTDGTLRLWPLRR
jgi:WD40 repeat protein